LQAGNGRIYTGYGEYGANTGPITVTTSTRQTNLMIAEFVADTEAVYNYRPIAGHLYAPSIDPRVVSDYSVDAPWRATAAVGAAHVYVMATLDDTDLIGQAVSAGCIRLNNYAATALGQTLPLGTPVVVRD
jgi:hypothetical protein